MAARLTVKWDDTAAIARLGKAVARLADPRPALDEIGGALVASTQRRFEAGVGPDGAPWKPSRRAQKEGGKTLVDTGRLLRSITHRVSVSGSQAELEVGTNVVYAGIHQFGGTIKRRARTQTLAFDPRGRFLRRSRARRRKAGFIPIAIAAIGAGETQMPARPFLGVDDGDERATRSILRRYLREAVS